MTNKNSFNACSWSLGFGHWSFLCFFGAVAAAGLLAVGNAEGVADAADNVIANARQIADTTATNKHDRVLLQVVAFAGNINGRFAAVGETHTGDFSQSGVRLLGRHRADDEANALLEAVF